MVHHDITWYYMVYHDIGRLADPALSYIVCGNCMVHHGLPV